LSRQPNLIFYINSVTGVGGAELSLIELASHLDRSRFLPSLLTEGEGTLAQRCRLLNIPVTFGKFPFFSRRRPWVYASAVWEIFRIVKQQKVRLIHINCDKAVPHAVLASKIARVPVICHVHDMTRAWFLPRYVKYLNTANMIIADSQATAQHCIKAGMRPTKLHVIYECFEMNQFQDISLAEVEHQRNEWGAGPGEILIGLIGQILRQKGHEEFIRAAARVVGQNVNARFIIVGDDSLSSDKLFLPYLKELSNDLGISKSLIFTGFIGKIPKVMAALDVVVVPSWEEPFGRVIVEAQASHRPVIATRAGGIPEIIEDNQTGLLVPPKDPNALAEAMIKLCSNPELRNKLGETGPFSAQRFDVESHTRHFEQIYEALLMKQGENGT
jgi:L-malate glycosyltransferase